MRAAARAARAGSCAAPGTCGVNGTMNKIKHCGDYFDAAGKAEENYTKQKLWILIAAEHVIIAAKLGLAALIPDEPAWVKQKLARDMYLLKMQTTHVTNIQEQERQIDEMRRMAADADAARRRDVKWQKAAAKRQKVRDNIESTDIDLMDEAQALFGHGADVILNPAQAATKIQNCFRGKTARKKCEEMKAAAKRQFAHK